MNKCALLLLTVIFLLPFGCSGSREFTPDIRIVDLDALESVLAEHRGEGVLLNFWAIWCVPCVEELPELLEVAREYRGRNGTVLGISYDLMIPEVTRDEVLEQMRTFVSERKIDIPILIYDADDYDAINERFDLPGPIPASVAIDSNGAIVDKEEGQAGKQRFVEMMERALGN